ncbi:MAG: hypothetical protein O7C75_12970, partial [Verrucomicrobia bacterium]|nr:hypothetical protein [Verrucomicrobiota bacterium]
MDALKLLWSLRLVASMTIILAIYLVSKLIFGIGYFVDATPKFSTLYLIRSGLMVIAAYLLFRFLTFPPRP